MPNLPTVELTQDQYDLVMGMFDGQHGGQDQPATAEEAYEIWHQRVLRSQIQNNQFSQVNQQFTADLEAAISQSAADLEVTWPYA